MQYQCQDKDIFNHQSKFFLLNQHNNKQTALSQNTRKRRTAQTSGFTSYSSPVKIPLIQEWYKHVLKICIGFNH